MNGGSSRALPPLDGKILTVFLKQAEIYLLGVNRIYRE